jgi:DNA-binding MarR family transcriptional regulator
VIAVTVKFSKIDKINAFVYNRWNNDIIMFLHNNPHHNTAAEIVRIRKSTKSHVSSSLKKLENKGLIKRKQSKDNKKHIT